MPEPFPFSKRTRWEMASNELSQSLKRLKQQNAPVIDLTESNPTRCGFAYLNDSLLKAFADPSNLHYEPSSKGMLATRKIISDFYNSEIHSENIFLTAS